MAAIKDTKYASMHTGTRRVGGGLVILKIIEFSSSEATIRWSLNLPALLGSDVVEVAEVTSRWFTIYYMSSRICIQSLFDGVSDNRV